MAKSNKLIQKDKESIKQRRSNKIQKEDQNAITKPHKTNKRKNKSLIDSKDVQLKMVEEVNKKVDAEKSKKIGKMHDVRKKMEDREKQKEKLRIKAQETRAKALAEAIKMKQNEEKMQRVHKKLVSKLRADKSSSNENQ